MGNPSSRSVREDTPRPIAFLLGLMVVIRVIVAIMVWLVLFLGVFLGYFTLPLIAASALVILYSATDIGLFITVRRREKAQWRREAFLRAQQKIAELDRLDMMDSSGDE